MLKKIKIPNREFGPAPWWAWMGDPTPTSIDRDLKRFMEMEVFEIIIIPLYGLRPEYMGREYLDLWEYTCRRCREWGLKLWIYDEFNWPSGTCAGKVLKQYPQFRQQAIQISTDDKTAGGRGQRAWRIVANENFQLAAYGAEWACGTTGYLDTLSVAAVHAYISMTHTAYQRAIGDYFGDVIIGFFTDEPIMVGGGAGLPYTPGLFDMFRERYGYDLRPRILALTAVAPDAARVRRDYWGLVTELFRENFFRQYADWCAAQGLQMTGHLLHEETLSVCVHRNGDMYAMLAEMQTPGIDLLSGVASFDGDGRIIPAAESAKRDITGKLIESVAALAGKERTLCEAFGCMPNSATLVDYKRAVDFLFHHGLSLINDNLFAGSLSSFRKFCGGHAFLTPWVKHYNLFAHHIRTMSFLNSGSQLVTSVGLYYPGTDARARYAPPQAPGLGPNFMAASWDATQRALHDLAHGLLRRHWDYYLVFDQALRTAATTSTGLQMGDFDCRVLIFPDIHYVDAETAAALCRFTQAGGVMICAGRVPMKLDKLGRARKVRWGAPARVVELNACGAAVVAEVVRVLQDRLQAPVQVSGAGAADVMATRRWTRAGEALFLSNFGARAADVAVEIDGAWRGYDTVAARMRGPLAVSERLLPGESRLFMRVGTTHPRAAQPPLAQPVAAFRNEWELRLPAGNVVSLPLAVFTGKNTARPPAARADTWGAPCSEMAPMELTPERPYWLRREIELAYQPHHLELIVDGCDGCEVFVNRRRIPAVPARRPVWDDDNLCCDIRNAVKRGRNEILVRYTPARIRQLVARMVKLNDLPPFVMRGDFLVGSRLDRPGMTPAFAALPGCVETGPLQPRGYAHFAGVAEYIQTVRLGKTTGPVILDMGRQNDLFEVEINGRSAGVLAWAPYRLEVSAWLKRGENRFVFRMRTALGGVLTRFYGGAEPPKPPVGMLETPVLLWHPRHKVQKAQ